MPTSEDFTNALNAAGVDPDRLASLLRVAGVQATIEMLRTKLDELRIRRDEAVRAAVEPIDQEVATTQAEMDAAVAQLAELRKGAK